MKILGVRVDNFSQPEIVKKIDDILSGDKFNQIATINPEIVLRAAEDEEYKNILNSCEINIADGFGINFGFWRNRKRLKCRFTGVDLMELILKKSDEKGLSVFLAANRKGLSTWQETRDAIQKNYPYLKIFGADLDRTDTVSDFLNISRYDIVFCNFGAPYQEKFLNSQKNAKIKLAMGVGGAFDFLTGKQKRSPIFLRKLGLEWVWRLALQPKRWRRIFDASVVFPFKVIFFQKLNSVTLPHYPSP